jgi:hypothetical protein
MNNSVQDVSEIHTGISRNSPAILFEERFINWCGAVLVYVLLDLEIVLGLAYNLSSGWSRLIGCCAKQSRKMPPTLRRTSRTNCDSPRGKWPNDFEIANEKSPPCVLTKTPSPVARSIPAGFVNFPITQRRRPLEGHGRTKARHEDGTNGCEHEIWNSARYGSGLKEEGCAGLVSSVDCPAGAYSSLRLGY